MSTDFTIRACSQCGTVIDHDPTGHHVWPLDDLVEHVTEGGEDCPCGPTTEPIKRADGSYGWLVSHHSLDGREQQENPQRNPSPEGLV